MEGTRHRPDQINMYKADANSGRDMVINVLTRSSIIPIPRPPRARLTRAFPSKVRKFEPPTPARDSEAA